jgi:hypothetical protein
VEKANFRLTGIVYHWDGPMVRRLRPSELCHTARIRKPLLQVNTRFPAAEEYPRSAATSAAIPVNFWRVFVIPGGSPAIRK